MEAIVLRTPNGFSIPHEQSVIVEFEDYDPVELCLFYRERHQGEARLTVDFIDVDIREVNIDLVPKGE